MNKFVAKSSAAIFASAYWVSHSLWPTSFVTRSVALTLTCVQPEEVEQLSAPIDNNVVKQT